MATRTFAVVSVAIAVVGTGCMAGMAAGHAAQMPSASGTAEAAPASGMTGAMTNCPMAVSGTRVAAADTPNGEAITFTTSPGGVADLRSRVRAMAEMHNQHHQAAGADQMHGGMDHGGMMGGGTMGGGTMGGGTMGGGTMGGGTMGGGTMGGGTMGGGTMGGGTMGGGTGSSGGMHASMMPPPSRAAVEDVDGGARLVVTPSDPADVDRLRTAMRLQAQHMQETGTCGMGQPGGR